MGEKDRGMTYVRKVIDAMTATLAHFNFSGQFTGFLGSSGPSQSTIFGSTSVLLVPMSFFSESSLAWPASRSIFSSKLELLGGGLFPFDRPVEVGFFSGSVSLAPLGIEDVAKSEAGASTAFGSVDNVASDEEYWATSEIGAGTALGIVETGAPDAAAPGAAPVIVSCSVDKFAFVADEDASVT